MHKLRPWEIDPNYVFTAPITPKESFTQKMRRKWEDSAWVRRDLGMGIGAMLIWPFVMIFDPCKSEEDLAEEAARVEERGQPPKA